MKNIDQERVIYECTGCGTVSRNPERWLEMARKAGHMSCCPERKIRPMQPASVAVPEGYALVPKTMLLDASSLEALVFVSGGISSDDDAPSYLDSVLWVGELLGDDDKPTYGLHACCTECEEEGSITLAEFAAAPHPVSGEQKAMVVVDAGEDGQWAHILPDVSSKIGWNLTAPPGSQHVSVFMSEYRIAVTPEHEGQWHADLHGDESEPMFHAERDTPYAAVLAVVAAYHARKGEQP